MKVFQIPDNRKAQGKQAFVTLDSVFLNEVCSYYGRDPKGLCVKVFYGNPLNGSESLEDALWGDNHDPKDHNQVRRNTKLLEGTKIQNICWLYGYSPRVYAVFEGLLNGKRVACQLTDYIEGNFTDQKSNELESVHKKINQLGKQFKFSEVKDILSYLDMINGKIFDLQQYAFDKDHIEAIKNYYFTNGRYGKVYYQNVPELGLTGGPRKSVDRINYLQLEKIDFKDKVVWDIGCAGGFFARYASKRGAKRVIGFDEDNTRKAAYVLSNYLGEFNIDYEWEDLSKGISPKYDKPDIVFFLSMNFHIDIPQRLFEADTVIFEDNGRETRHDQTLDYPWAKHYKNIKFVGRAEDHGMKAIYHITR